MRYRVGENKSDTRCFLDALLSLFSDQDSGSLLWLLLKGKSTEN